MGNPVIQMYPCSQERGLSRDQLVPDPGNGVLGYLGAEAVVRGSKTLPPPCQAEAGNPLRTVDLDSGDRGMVRITYELGSYRHRRSSFWHWRAVRADLI